MKITEVFYSVQGEGSLTGVPSVFVRTAGCNLHCRWCDTPYSSWKPEGEEMTVDQALALVTPHPTRFCVITGGEPMIAPDIHGLAARLVKAGKHVTIETAATVPPGGISCSLASLSPKMSNSVPGGDVSLKVRTRHEETRLNLEALRMWMDGYEYQLKFAIQSCADVDEVVPFLTSLGRTIPPERVMLMPEGNTVNKISEHTPVVLDACKRYGFRFCDRLHLRLFGNKRGT
jgi:7-carboxy-7-deazaguanine synthase